jgi:hypothetical protein
MNIIGTWGTLIICTMSDECMEKDVDYSPVKESGWRKGTGWRRDIHRVGKGRYTE